MKPSTPPFDTTETLADLFVERAVLRLIVAGLLLVVAVLFLNMTRPAQPESEAPVEPVSAVALMREIHAREGALTEWQQLILALALAESRLNPEARGEAHDGGILQITPIYAAEASRLTGRDYSPAAAYDIAASLEMFAAIQDHYNPTHDIDEAIRRHNPGAGPGYAAEVRRNLELVRRYETVRRAILQNTSKNFCK